MKVFKIFFTIAVSFVLLATFASKSNAVEEDFSVNTKTTLFYNTGDDFVVVETEYVRAVNNSKYYFPASGEKILHIPDVLLDDSEETEAEREYKISSLNITDGRGTKLKYSLEKKTLGEGIFVTIPNYKTTTSSSSYKILMTYKTHDYVVKMQDSVMIFGTSLPKDTQFDYIDESNKTLTVYSYNFVIVTDSRIPSLAKAYPAYTAEKKGDRMYYNFSQTERLESAPYLEFGTSALYKFEMSYTTPKTDTIIPEKYSNVIQALSTNIYEISLPREFSENNQKVFFKSISPTPKDIYKDSEGNILALFEVPANQESKIVIEGYVLVEQNSIDEEDFSLEIDLQKYLADIHRSSYVQKYLTPTQYWESDDPYIVTIAQDLLKDKTTFLEVIEADYLYINDTLDYDTNKANSDNERIGAVNALKGAGAVCMEYADSMIAILRAQGIPARAALGYANLREESTNQVRHQWVQVWVADYGWLSIDPTFESKNLKIGQQIDRVLWETFNEDSLSNIRIYSADNISDLGTDGYDLKIYGIQNNIDLESKDVYTDLIPEKEYANDEIPEKSTLTVADWFNTFLKATVIGRALIVTLPILIVLVVIVAVLMTVSAIVKRLKKS